MLLPECKPFMDLIYELEKPLKVSVIKFLRSQECGFDKGFPKVCCAPLPKTAPFLTDNPTEVSVGNRQSSSSPQTTWATTQKPVKEVEQMNHDLEAFDEFYDDLSMFDVLL